MKIMCHVGPWSAGQYSAIARAISVDAEITLASGHKKFDQTGLSSRYYDFLDRYQNDGQMASAGDIDMIKRCRLLRALEPNESKKHLDCMRFAIAEALDRFNPDLVLSETIDSFLMDLLYAECVRRDIRFIGLVPSFVNGYFRVTARGEHHTLRTPAPEEVQKVLSLLEGKNYHPAFLQDSKQRPYLSATKRWARNLVKPPYFFVKRAISGERYNYHYWATQIVSRQWFHIAPKLNLGDHGWEGKVRAAGKPIIYVPLQMIPEATVDYWCDSLEAVDYDNTLVQIIGRLSDRFHFLIKEHPNVLGFRNPAIYKRLASLPGVTICPTYINSNRLVELSATLLVWTGTAGFEAAIRGLPVLALCKAYYMSGRKFKVVSTDVKSDEVESFVTSQADPLSQDEKIEMIRFLLSGLLHGKYIIDGSWNSRAPSDVANAMGIGEALRSTILCSSL